MRLREPQQAGVFAALNFRHREMIGPKPTRRDRVRELRIQDRQHEILSRVRLPRLGSLPIDSPPLQMSGQRSKLNVAQQALLVPLAEKRFDIHQGAGHVQIR